MKYGKEKHGDGLTVMVPMDVEPPEGIDVLLWRDDEWTCAQSKMVKACRHANYDGWSFIPDVKFISPALPPKPEPVKSYAEYLDDSGFFRLYNYSFEESWTFLPRDPNADNPPKHKALIHFIFDHLPTDEDRADALAILKGGA
jgi:hypothetical protein